MRPSQFALIVFLSAGGLGGLGILFGIHRRSLLGGGPDDRLRRLLDRALRAALIAAPFCAGLTLVGFALLSGLDLWREIDAVRQESGWGGGLLPLDATILLTTYAVVFAAVFATWSAQHPLDE